MSSSIVDAAENYSERLNSDTEQFENRLLAYRDRLRAKKDKIADLTQKRDSIPAEKYLSQYERLSKSINKLQDYIYKEYQLSDVDSKIKKVDVMTLELKSQFRCSESDNYLDWLDAVLYNDLPAIEAMKR